MWIMTPEGFYSAVAKYGNDGLTIRARSKADLVRLQQHLPGKHPMDGLGGSDYPWRLYVTHQEWADYLADTAKRIDYNNFKSEVERVQGYARHDTYAAVWSDLLRIENESDAESRFRGPYKPYWSQFAPATGKTAPAPSNKKTRKRGKKGRNRQAGTRSFVDQAWQKEGDYIHSLMSDVAEPTDDELQRILDDEQFWASVEGDRS